MLDAKKVRRALVEYFKEKAQKRFALAEEFQRDSRNHQSGQALEQIAQYIAALPDDDAALLLFIRSPNLFIDEEIFQEPRRQWDGVTESECDSVAFQCGFHDSLGSPAEWFAGWIELVASEAGDGEMDLELRGPG